MVSSAYWTARKLFLWFFCLIGFWGCCGFFVLFCWVYCFLYGFSINLGRSLRRLGKFRIVVNNSTDKKIHALWSPKRACFEKDASQQLLLCYYFPFMSQSTWKGVQFYVISEHCNRKVFKVFSFAVFRCSFGSLGRKKPAIVKMLKFFLVKISGCKGKVCVVYISVCFYKSQALFWSFPPFLYSL